MPLKIAPGASLLQSSRLLAALLLIGAQSSAYGDQPPNIIFLLTDDHRADCLSCAGAPVLRTPHLDRLAEEGVRFSNAFVTTSICAISRASIFTGQYAARHGVVDFRTALTAQQLAASYLGRLDDAGYRIGFIGKWGVGAPSSELLDYDRAFGGQGTYYGKDGAQTHLTERIGDQIGEFVEGCDPQEPFCLSVSFKAPHADESGVPREFDYDRRFTAYYQDEPLPPPTLAGPDFYQQLPPFLQDTEGRRRWRKRFATDAMRDETVRNYYRLITGVDEVVGRTRRYLGDADLADNTVIVFASDNGFYLGDRGWSDKWFAHELSIRIPLIIYDPRQRGPMSSRVVDQIALNIDIAPTMLDYAQVPPSDGMQGRSLKGLVDDRQNDDWRSEFFYEHNFRHRGIPRSEGVRTARWKYIRYVDEVPSYEELYDLAEDPDEARNLAKEAAHAHTLAKMQEKWRAWRQAAK